MQIAFYSRCGGTTVLTNIILKKWYVSHLTMLLTQFMSVTMKLQKRHKRWLKIIISKTGSFHKQPDDTVSCLQKIAQLDQRKAHLKFARHCKRFFDEKGQTWATFNRLKSLSIDTGDCREKAYWALRVVHSPVYPSPLVHTTTLLCRHYRSVLYSPTQMYSHITHTQTQ